MHAHTTHASHMLVKAPVYLPLLSKRAYLCHLFIYFVLCADVCFLYGEMAGFFEGIWNKVKAVYRMCRGDQPAPDPEAGNSGSASPPLREPQGTAADAQPQGASAQVAGEEDIVKTEEYEPAMVRYYMEVGEEEVVNARRGLFDRRDRGKGGIVSLPCIPRVNTFILRNPADIECCYMCFVCVCVWGWVGGGEINTKCTAYLVERKHVLHTKLSHICVYS